MLAPDPIANSHDRLGFTVMMALLAHAALILGVGFVAEELTPREGQSRLEITLAHQRSDEAPKQADFLAQHNQLASGTLAQKQELSTTREALFHDEVVRETDPLPTPVPPPSITQTTRAVITRRGDSHATGDTAKPADQTSASPSIAPPLDSLAREIASLEARIKESLQAEARRPRIHRLTSVASRSADDAQYLFHWQQRIERIGNQHYPDEARRNRIFGELRLMVAINVDGSVREIKILQSSGKSVLDTAAIKIVKMAAPFAPFPAAMRKNTDVIEIIRTWQFSQNRLTSVQ